MSQENHPLDETDIFIKNYKYPNAELIFKTKLESLEKIKDDCIVVLDTNVLIAPYDFTSETAIKQFKQQFPERCIPLIAKERLVIPGQVAREFADLRSLKLKDITYTLSQKKEKLQRINQMATVNPVIDDLPEFKEVQRLETELDTLLKEQLDNKLKEYKKAVDTLVTQIEQWGWNDPISELFYTLFSNGVVIDPPIEDENAFKAELRRRYNNQIPPGYKDKKKLDEGVGDLLIWQTILFLGRTKKTNVIFVTGEQKSDWFVRVNKKVLSPRYELIYEFMNNSGGKSFHILKYPEFLELYGAKPEEINQLQKEEARQEEVQQIENLNTNTTGKTGLDYFVDRFVLKWLNTEYVNKQIIEGDLYSNVDYIIVESEQTFVGIIVRSITNTVAAQSLIRKTRNEFVHNIYGKSLTKFILFLAFENENSVNQVLSSLSEDFIINFIPNSMLLVFACFDENGTLRINWRSR